MQRRQKRRQVLRAAAVTTTRRDVCFSAPVTITASAAVAGQPARPPRIDIVAYNGGELLVDGFDLPVVIDLAGAIIPPTLPLNVDHCQDIGSLLGSGQTSLVNNSLSISGTITASNANAQEVVRLATQEAFPWQASIKAIVLDSRRIAPGQQFMANGRTFIGPMIHATQSQVTHCAVLGEGADQTSSVRIAAKAAKVLKGSIMTFEQWLASLGLDPATLTAEATAVLQTQYAATMATPTAEAKAAPTTPAAPAAPAVPQAAAAASASNSPAVLLAASRKAEADEIRRVGAIRAKARDFPLIAAKAIEEGWSEDKVELEVIKASRPTGPSHQAVNQPAEPLVLEAAMAMQRRIKGHEKQYSDQVLQAAHSQFRRGIGLQQLLLIAAAANGYSVGPGMRISNGNLKSVLEHAFGRPGAVLQAASGGSLTGILSNIANKELLEGYMEDDQTWREIAAVKSVNDFKTVTSYRMLDDMEYEELGPNGQIKHGTIGEESFTRRAKTYAKMAGLTRVDIINDDLGAYDDLRNRVGRGSSMKFNRVFWAKWLALSTAVFTTGNGNYISGATTNLGVDGVGLQLGILKFDQLRSPAADGSKVPGGRLAGRAEILLHGSALQFNADRLYQSTNVNTGGAATAESVGNANIHAGKYRPVKSVWVDDTAMTGYSATAWWLLRNPSILAAIVVSFLNGVETPTVEESDADFDTLGILFRGYHDFGVDDNEPLAGIMSKGAA